MSRDAPNKNYKDSIKKAVETDLLNWFSTHHRALPWRCNRTPYRVWIAEVMLQQTRVDTVINYYQRWMKSFPSWQALATAPQADVLKAWEGLGYYSRARNLHATARIISDQYGGNVSNAWRQAARCAHPIAWHLRKFPGIGPYTAAAIASLAFDEDSAVVDGNVIRVLSRLYAYGGETKDASGKRKMQAWADELLVKGRAGEFNEAMMELGALVCLPKKPQCDACPLQTTCGAWARGTPENFPILKKKVKVPHLIVGAAVTMNRKGEVLIAQRKQTDMLGGLWEFPGGKLERGETIEECIARELKEELGINVEVGEFLMMVKHAYSHFTMTMYVYYTKIISGRPRLLDCAGYAWVKPAELSAYAYSKADLYVVTKLQESIAPS